MKSAEGTQTEEGSKWLKKHKRRSKVREIKSLEENIKENKVVRKMNHGYVNKRKKTLIDAL
jgi:hypothetical protein